MNASVKCIYYSLKERISIFVEIYFGSQCRIAVPWIFFNDYIFERWHINCVYNTGGFNCLFYDAVSLLDCSVDVEIVEYWFGNYWAGKTGVGWSRYCPDICVDRL